MGRAKNPDFSKVKSKVGSKNENFHRRREPNKVKIFNDKNYMKAVKVTFLTTKTKESKCQQNFVLYFRKSNVTQVREFGPGMVITSTKGQGPWPCRRLKTISEVKAEQVDDINSEC